MPPSRNSNVYRNGNNESQKVPLSIQAVEVKQESSTCTSPSSSSNSFLQSPRNDTFDVDEEKALSSGPRRSAASVKGTDKEKRKRSRVTPDQLAHLERYFAVDRSPTASRRRDISELLGMHERQTQIWFQNRRAKAKLSDGKNGIREDGDHSSDSPPTLTKGYEADLQSLIHEDEPVTIIPCTDLTVGTWRRIATSVHKHDLVAYVCEMRRCLTWFIQSDGYGYKMEIPFKSIIDTEFKNIAPASGLVVFKLAHSPVFYLEQIIPARAGGPMIRVWKRCSDWTEGHQASQVLRHTLVGSAIQLAHVLRNLHAHASLANMPPHTSASHLPPPPSSVSADSYLFDNQQAKLLPPNCRKAQPTRAFTLGPDLRQDPNGSFPQIHTTSPNHSQTRPRLDFDQTIYPNYGQAAQTSGFPEYSSHPLTREAPPSYAPPQAPYYNPDHRSIHQRLEQLPVGVINEGRQSMSYDTPSPPQQCLPYQTDHLARLSLEPHRHPTTPQSPLDMPPDVYGSRPHI